MLELIKLNFPEKYQIRLKECDDKLHIFCLVRKKWLLFTPEEWVRQHIIFYLTQTKKYSLSALAVEVNIDINGMKKRADIIVFNQEKTFLIVECKAPTVKVNQDVFDQIARYNYEIDANYLMVSNGLMHYYCQMDYQNKQYHFLADLP